MIIFVFLEIILSIFPFVNTYEFNDFVNDQNPQKWNDQAKETIETLLKTKLNQNVAKNLIIFLGDGMGQSTITSGRIRKGQKKGMRILKVIEKVFEVSFNYL
jgi:alkaline phosphatase